MPAHDDDTAGTPGHNLRIVTVPEGELEADQCHECGSDNVLKSPPGCKSCAEWLSQIASAGIHLSGLD